ncbi:MAG: tetratricopeptide repeat protein [Deltaproteobacteria bacterium]|nr:tetratricopeptide repeat protein [Deltaproteobacteria bacterium]
MRCHRCGHENISSFRFCEVCLAPLRNDSGPIARSDRPVDVIGQFFADADLLEQGSADTSRGTVTPQGFDLPWKAPSESSLLLFAREREARQVADHALEALRGRRLAAITVQGEAGSGRSTVLGAVRDRAVAELAGARVLAVTAQGCVRAYALLERLLRLRFDIGDFLAGTIAGERFERTVEALYADPAGAEIARTCGPMLGFQFWNDHDIDFLDRAEQAQRAHEALHGLLHKVLADPPTLILVDEAGEADPESLEAIAKLLAQAPELPVAVVFATDRRGAVRHTWLAERPILDLAPLPPTTVRDLARRALDGVQGVGDGHLDALVDLGSGRPGRVLAAIEALHKRGAIALQEGTWRLDDAIWRRELPAHDLLAARGGRLDGLDDFQMAVATAAAVFGAHFWAGGVVALLRGEAADHDRKGARTVDELGRDKLPDRVGRAVQFLVDRGVVAAEPQALLPTENPHRFVDEADCASLLELLEPAQRQRYSQQAAVWLQMVSTERTGDLAEILAPLWLLAGDRVHAAHLYLRAGSRALDEYRNATARALLDKARDLAPQHLAHVHAEAALGLGRLYEIDGQWAQAEALYRDALELAWKLRARIRGARALQHLGRMFRTQGKAVAAIDHLAPALRLYEAAQDLKGLASACDDIGRAYWTVGRLDPAQQFLKRAAQYREKMGDRAGQAFTLCSLGIVLLSKGRLEQALTYLDRAVELQRSRNNLGGLTEALNALGVCHITAGHHELAVGVMQEALGLAQRVGNRRWVALLQNNLGEVLGLLGRADEGEALLYQAVEGAGKLADNALLSDAARNLAVAARGRGDTDRAIKWARRSVAAAGASDMVRTRAFAHKTLAEILGDAGDDPAALDAWDKAAEWFSKAGEVRELEACLQAHAAYLMRLGRSEPAAELLRRVERLESGAAT